MFIRKKMQLGKLSLGYTDISLLKKIECLIKLQVSMIVCTATRVRDKNRNIRVGNYKVNPDRDRLYLKTKNSRNGELYFVYFFGCPGFRFFKAVVWCMS